MWPFALPEGSDQPSTSSLWLLVLIWTSEVFGPHDPRMPQFWEIAVRLGQYGLRMKDRPQTYRKRAYTDLSFGKQFEGKTYSFAECNIVVLVALHLFVTVNDSCVRLSQFKCRSHKVVHAACIEIRNPSPEKSCFSEGGPEPFPFHMPLGK